MSAIGKLKRIREGHRLCCDKSMEKAKEKLDYNEMNVLLASLEAREGQLKKCHEDIMEVLTEDNDIVAEIEYANDHADKVIAVKTKLR